MLFSFIKKIRLFFLIFTKNNINNNKIINNSNRENSYNWKLTRNIGNNIDTSGAKRKNISYSKNKSKDVKKWKNNEDYINNINIRGYFNTI